MKNTPFSLLQISSSLLLLALSGASVEAQTTWNNPTSNAFWNVADNWSNGVPTSATDVYFSGTGGNIVLSANVGSAFKSLIFNASNSNYTLKSDSSTIRSFSAGSSSGIFRGAYNASNSQLRIEGVSIRSNLSSSFAENGSGNSLLLTGTSSFTTDYIYGFGIGSGTGTAAANSNNTVTVENGSTLQTGFVNVGGKGAGNSLIITGTGSLLKVNGTGATHYLTVGNNTAAATNSVKIINGATADIVFRSTRIAGGSLVIGKGSSLLHNHATLVQTLTIGSKGTLFGAGTITADTLLYDGSISGTGGPGAKVYVGETETGFGKLDFTGEWQNSNITLNLEVGNLTGGAVAGTNYDLLDINGVFAHGGNVSIDIGGAVFGNLTELQLIRWTSATGLASALNVSFINGHALDYDIRADGLYLQGIPEPGSVALLTLGVCGLGLWIRNKRKA